MKMAHQEEISSARNQQKFTQKCDEFSADLSKVLIELQLLRTETKRLRKECYDKANRISQLELQLRNETRQNSEQAQKLQMAIEQIKREETEANKIDFNQINLETMNRQRDLYKKNLHEAELANIDLRHKNDEQLEVIGSLRKIVADDSVKIRCEITTIQKDLNCFEQQRNNINESFKNIQKIVHHGAAATKFFKENYDRKVIELLRLTEELLMAKRQNSVAASGRVVDNRQREVMQTEMQTKVERLLDERDHLKEQIDAQTNAFANSLALSTEIIAQLTAELGEMRRNGNDSTGGDGSLANGNGATIVIE